MAATPTTLAQASLFPIRAPAWFDGPRHGQMEAVDEILSAFRDNGGAKVVMYEAPVGAGKTIVAESVRQHLALGSSPRSGDAECCYDPAHGHLAEEGCCSDPSALERSDSDPSQPPDFSTLYVCSGISLQHQFHKDFPYSEILLGRSNYRTLTGPAHVTCADCTKQKGTECAWCPDHKACPYRVAKIRALKAELAVTNTAYYITEANGPGQFSGSDLVICDEADLLESALMSAVEVVVTDRMQTELGIGPPDRKTKPEAWEEWRQEVALPAVDAAWRSIPASTTDAKLLKRRLAYLNLRARLAILNLADGTWIYDGYQLSRPKINFRPVHVRDIGVPWFFRHGKRFLLMSATLISAEQMAMDLGLAPDSWAFVESGSTFPAARAPIVVRGVADMSRKGGIKERLKLLVELKKIMARFPSERILVHTHSYDLTRFLARHLTSSRVMAYDSARERERTLNRFRNTPGAVLLAPSLDRGIDLPHDLCRIVVVAKIPFPYLGDKQVNARLHMPGGQTWYQVQTVRTLAQAVGRGMRSADDWCYTFILDSNFYTNVYQRSRHLLPKWFRERLDWHGRVVIDA